MPVAVQKRSLENDLPVFVNDLPLSSQSTKRSRTHKNASQPSAFEQDLSRLTQEIKEMESGK
jgi:hypothetical protein